MLRILGAGASGPTTVIDNAFLEALDVGTTAQWIEEKIGIRERVTSLPLDYIRHTRNADPRGAPEAATTDTTTLGAEAAAAACRSAGISPRDVGLVICNSCTPTGFFPGEGARVADVLGASCDAYDVVTACPAFALHVDYLARVKEDRLPDYVLCLSTATVTHKVDYNDRTDGAIWGDGAAAWIVSPRLPGKLKVLDTFFSADTTRAGAVVMDTFGYFRQDGRAVRDFSVRQTVRLVKRIEAAYPIDWSRDVFIGHQANRTMLEQVVNNRGVPPENHWHNVTYLGNQAGAGAPATLAGRWDDIVPGQRIVVAVVGAGLSWGSVLLEA